MAIKIKELIQLAFSLVCIFVYTSSYAQSKDFSSNFSKITAKELFLCMCINEGFKSDSLLRNDASAQIILELALFNSKDKYGYEYMDKVADLAKKIADSIPTGLDGKKAVFLGCINYYKSKELSAKLKSISD